MFDDHVNGRDSRPEWTVSCKDIVGRDREIHVRIDGAQVTVQVPPGESAVLTGEQVVALRSALHAAHTVAYERADGAKTGHQEGNRPWQVMKRASTEVPAGRARPVNG